MHRNLKGPTEASVSRIAPYIHFADETVKKILSRPEGLTPDLCGEVARNPLFSSTTRTELQQAVQNRIANIGPNLGISPQDLKGVGCGCSDCDRFLVPVFTQNRGPKVGISVKGRDAAKKHFEERLERTRSWGVTWQLKRGKLQISRPSGLISLQQWLPSIQEAKKMVEALGLPQALSAAYARMTEAISNANAGQKRPIDVDGDVANKRARTA
ncbi:2og-fe oxygenase [Moniliophthora roreri]|nr:2og-fe oxygenase [Moniliophthora roreri]